MTAKLVPLPPPLELAARRRPRKSFLECLWRDGRPVQGETCDGCGAAAREAGPIRSLAGAHAVRACKACCRSPVQLRDAIRRAALRL